MALACTLEADTGLLRYSEQRLADLYTTGESAGVAGYASRAELFDSAHGSYRLFRARHCPECGGALGGEFKLLYRRTHWRSSAGMKGERWQRALDVDLECPTCGYHNHNVLANGPSFAGPSTKGVVVSRC